MFYNNHISFIELLDLENMGKPLKLCCYQGPVQLSFIVRHLL